MFQLDSATSLIQAAKNLMNAVVLTVKSSYVASTKYPRPAGQVVVSSNSLFTVVMLNNIIMRKYQWNQLMTVKLILLLISRLCLCLNVEYYSTTLIHVVDTS